MKLRILLPAILLGLVASQAAWADLTVRYKITAKAGAGMPQQLTAGLEPAMKMIPTEVVLQYHGDMARSELLGKTSLIDYGRRQITILDTQGQRFATAPLDQYPSTAISGATPMPAAAAEALRNLKIDVQTKKQAARPPSLERGPRRLPS